MTHYCVISRVLVYLFSITLMERRVGAEGAIKARLCHVFACCYEVILDESARMFPPLCWPFLSVFPSTWFSVPRSPSPSLAGRLAWDTALIVFLMALDVPELIVTAEFFPHEWIWEILPVSAACVNVPLDSSQSSEVCLRHTEMCRCCVCSSWSFIDEQWCYIEKHVKSMHTESSPGPIITNFYTTQGLVCLFLKTIWLIL